MRHRITNYHRDAVAKYYKRLLDRYGLHRLLRRIPMLKRIVWTLDGLYTVEIHLHR